MNADGGSVWLLPRRALGAPLGPDWRRWDALVREAGQPWRLSDERLPAVSRALFATAWERPDEPPDEVRRRLDQAWRGALHLAARQRLMAAFWWLFDQAPPGARLSAEELAELRAVAALEPDLLPPDGSDEAVLRPCLTVLELLRRYGFEERDVYRRLAETVGLEPPDDGPAGWAVDQLLLVATWVSLCRGSTQSAVTLAGRCRLARDSWIGRLALGLLDPAAARQRANRSLAYQRRLERSLLATAPLAGQDGSAAPAWWAADAAGWLLLAGPGPVSAEQVRAITPSILTGRYPAAAGEQAGMTPTGLAR